MRPIIPCQKEEKTITAIMDAIAGRSEYELFKYYALGDHRQVTVDVLVKKGGSHFLAVEVVRTLQESILSHRINLMKRVADAIPIAYAVITDGDKAVGIDVMADGFFKEIAEYSQNDLADILHKYLSEERKENDDKICLQLDFEDDLLAHKTGDNQILEFAKNNKDNILCRSGGIHFDFSEFFTDWLIEEKLQDMQKKRDGVVPLYIAGILVSDD